MNRRQFAFVFACIGVISLGMYTVAPETPDKMFINGCLGLALFVLLMVGVVKSQEQRPINWMTPDVLFALSFSVIHYTYLAYWTFGFFGNQQEIWFFRHAHCPHTVAKTTIMTVTCLSAFLTGYYGFAKSKPRALLFDAQITSLTSKNWGLLGKSLVRVGFLMFLVYVALVGPSVVFGKYAGTDVHGFGPNMAFQIGQVTLGAGFAVCIIARQRLSKRKWGFSFIDIMLTVVTLVAIGFHGDRSTLMFIAFCGLFAYAEYFKPISFKQAAVGGFACIIMLGLIFTVRGAASDGAKWDPIKNVNTALLNFGGSSLCAYVAVDHIPEKHDYYMGRMQVSQVAGIVPFGRRLFSLATTTDSSSSRLFTTLIQGSAGGKTAGTGTGMFADFYCDFGYLGTIAIFFMTGFGASYAQFKARSTHSILWQIFYIMLCAHLALVARYTLVNGLIRYVIYSVFYAIAISMVLGIPLRAYFKRATGYTGQQPGMQPGFQPMQPQPQNIPHQPQQPTGPSN